MANIKNTKEWVDNVRQIEVGDRVIGGTDAPINICLSHLVGRTGYLKDKIDAVPTDSVAGLLKISSVTNSTDEDTAASLKAVKAAYDKAEESAGKGLPVGAVIGFPRAVTSQEGFLKADGSTFNQSTYPDLHRVLGGNKLPKLNRSDVGMTAYFPFGDIPDGWIKYDDIATKVTQAAYPELYRKLVAQYGSIAAVPKAEDRFIRNAAGGLTVGQTQLDEIKRHVHKHISSDNASSSRIGKISSYFEDNTELISDGAVTVYADRNWNDNGWITPKADSQFATGGAETRPKAIAMVLCIKAKNSLDDVVLWIKAYGKVTNAGTLDASTLAAGLQNKSDKGHTHTAAEITDLAQAVGNLFTRQFAETGYLKLPGGLILQWGKTPTVADEQTAEIMFPIAFQNAVLNIQLTENVKTTHAQFVNHLAALNATLSKFTFWVNSSLAVSTSAYWFAIGY
ncbi:gp53-like domain-containing protein [Eikenella corrodens]|uniref:gp53-like domain-containing protein n=1 Tax=Eikenella corrodens TaxID=539 RepID=UPI00129BF82D|nr:tail fiber protein [Eikenella corrodens]